MTEVWRSGNVPTISLPCTKALRLTAPLGWADPINVSPNTKDTLPFGRAVE